MKDRCFADYLAERRAIHVELWSDGWCLRRGCMEVPHKARYKSREAAERAAERRAKKENGRVVVHDNLGRIIQRWQFGHIRS